MYHYFIEANGKHWELIREIPNQEYQKMIGTQTLLKQMKTENQGMAPCLAKEQYVNYANYITILNEFDQKENVYLLESEDKFSELAEESNRDNYKYVLCKLELSLAKELVCKYMKSQEHCVKILYYGESFKERLKDIAVEMDRESMVKIVEHSSIQFENNHYTRAMAEILYEEDAIYSVLVLKDVPNQRIKEIEHDYKFYLNALCKR